MTNLSVVVKKIGLEPTQSKMLLDSFGDLFVRAHKLSALAKGIKVTDIGQVDEMQKARELRLQLKDVRVEANKAKVKLKEGYLRGGNAVQKIFNDIRDITKPEEERLLEQEKFAERIQAEKDNKIEAQRNAELAKYVEDVGVYSLHPKQLSTESFNKILETQKQYFELRQEKEAREEKERLAKIEADKKEQERIRKENVKLKLEAEKREKAERALRAKEEAKLKKERQAREKLEAQLKAQQDAQEKKAREVREAEEARKLAEDRAKQKALLAPDKEKLLKLANNIALIKYPALQSKQAQDICENIMSELMAIAEKLEQEAKKL